VSTQSPNPADLIEAYLDGSLPPSEREGFERRLQTDAALRAELALQEWINGSLARLFREEPAARAAMSARQPSRTSARWIALAAAAVLALAAVGIWYFSSAPQPTPKSPIVQPTAQGPSLRRQFRNEVASGFVPETVCTTPEQFQGWVTEKFGEPLRPGAVPKSVQFVGWNYSSTLSAYTGVLLAKVDAQPVIVLMDKAENDRPPREDDGSEHIFRRQIGNLVLYEVSTLAEPKILPLLE
jgi:hypothetical protein